MHSFAGAFSAKPTHESRVLLSSRGGVPSARSLLMFVSFVSSYLHLQSCTGTHFCPRARHPARLARDGRKIAALTAQSKGIGRSEMASAIAISVSISVVSRTGCGNKLSANVQLERHLLTRHKSKIEQLHWDAPADRLCLSQASHSSQPNRSAERKSCAAMSASAVSAPACSRHGRPTSAICVV